MTKNIYRVSAFTEDGLGGNAAGVVLNADLLTVDDMLKIAKEIGYSETAFVMRSSKADFRVRFFTPVDEVDLCGHATVATFNLMRDLGIINVGEYTQETKAGILKVIIAEHHIYMEQNTPKYYDIIGEEEIKNCFVSKTKDYILDMPIQIVSTGLKDIMLPIKDLDTLTNLEPNMTMIDEISRKYDVVGIHAFCLETLNGCEAHARNFAPRYGIDEESATGTSNAALSCYLIKHSKNEFNDSFTIEQGYSMNKPSKILVKLVIDNNKIVEVYVGGSSRIISYT